jgi:CheY-like chemotaxis protein
MMPVMDGFSFIEACQKEKLCDDVPIVVVSVVHEALRRVLDLRVNACIAKPFDLEDLVRTVGRFARPNGHTTL